MVTLCFRACVSPLLLPLPSPVIDVVVPVLAHSEFHMHKSVSYLLKPWDMQIAMQIASYRD